MTVTSRENWTIGIQIVTAVGILVIAVFSFVEQLDEEFRDEMRSELAAIRSEMHEMNTRLSRVEGFLRVPDDE